MPDGCQTTFTYWIETFDWAKCENCISIDPITETVIYEPQGGTDSLE